MITLYLAPPPEYASDTKLRYIGFGERVVSRISMYSVRISLDYVLSEPLYFTQGVKLQNSKVGVKTDAELITTLYFADDKSLN